MLHDDDIYMHALYSITYVPSAFPCQRAASERGSGRSGRPVSEPQFIRGPQSALAIVSRLSYATASFLDRR